MYPETRGKQEPRGPGDVGTEPELDDLIQLRSKATVCTWDPNRGPRLHIREERQARVLGFALRGLKPDLWLSSHGFFTS